MNCFVIGNGGWGTALGMVLANNNHEVTLWGPFEEEIQAIRNAGENTVYLPGVELPQNLNWTSDPADVKNADLVVLVVPSRFVRATLETFKPHLPENALIVSATKGLDEQTHQRMSEVAADVLGRDVAILSGPSHAEEVTMSSASNWAARSKTLSPSPPESSTASDWVITQKPRS